MTPCIKPYACHPATIFAFLLATSNTNVFPHGFPSSAPSSPLHLIFFSFRTLLPTHSPNTLKASQSPSCCPPPKKYIFAGGFRASKLPILMKDGAIRVRTHADSVLSRMTGVAGREMSERERVVGIPRACNAKIQAHKHPVEGVLDGQMYLHRRGILEWKNVRRRGRLRFERMGYGQHL